MLNRDLVAQFQRISAENATGSLNVHFANNRLRFWFDAGELQLLDLGENKEHLMARKFLDYHMIGPEIHRHVLDVCKKTPDLSPVEILRRQSLVSDGEIEQIARTLVEDLLCACFGTNHHDLSFTDGDGNDSYDLDRSAVRLRIATEVLLRMVESRASEEERVIQETGGWDAVFTHEEQATATEDLEDYEKQVLSMVDGKRSIEDLAKTLRTSSMNMGRTLVSLAAKGYVRRADPMVSGRRGAGSTSGSRRMGAAAGSGRHAADGSPPSAKAAISAAVASAPPVAEMVATAHRGPSRAALVVLSAVLVTVVGVWMLVRASSEHRAALAGVEESFLADVAQGDLQAAQARVDDARKAAGGDLAATHRVDALAHRLDAALAEALTRAGAAIDQHDFAAAHQVIDHLPPARVPAEATTRLATGEREFAGRSQALATEVEGLLRDDRADEALKRLADADERTGAAARDLLDRWRVISLEQATLPGTPPARRERLVELIKASHPNDLQREQLTRIEVDLARSYGRQRDAVKTIAAQLAQGAWREAQAEAERLNLKDGGGGDEGAALREALARVRDELEGMQKRLTALVRDNDDPAALAPARAEVAAALEKYPQASNKAELTGLAQATEALAVMIGQGSIAEETSRVRASMADARLDESVSSALAARVQRLAQVDADARSALEFARRLAGDGRWDEAIEALVALRKRGDWRRASAYEAADQDLLRAKANRTRSDDTRRRFEDALAKGDIALAHDLARELGMKALPLRVESVPVGAEVRRDGKVLGTAPMLIEIAASDRNDLELEIAAPGYESRTVHGHDAVNGWRLAVELPRATVARADARMVVTARLGVIGKDLWLAGPTQVARVAPDGTVSTFTLEGSAFSAGAGGRRLNEPVYAPPSALDGAVYVATRDSIALRVAEGRVERLSIGVRSDQALAGYASTVVDNRRWLIAAGIDGAAHAVDPKTPDSSWTAAGGAAFVTGPVVVADAVLLARIDGTIEALEADNGRQLAGTSLGEPILAAWAEGDGIAGLTRTRAWRWTRDGVVAVPLPREAASAARGVFLTADRHAFVRAGEAWADVGQAPGTATLPPTAWNGQAAVVIGKALHVIGARGFVVRADADFLAPVEVEGRLAVVSSDGHVAFYAP